MDCPKWIKTTGRTIWNFLPPLKFLGALSNFTLLFLIQTCAVLHRSRGAKRSALSAARGSWPAFECRSLRTPGLLEKSAGPRSAHHGLPTAPSLRLVRSHSGEHQRHRELRNLGGPRWRLRGADGLRVARLVWSEHDGWVCWWTGR